MRVSTAASFALRIAIFAASGVLSLPFGTASSSNMNALLTPMSYTSFHADACVCKHDIANRVGITLPLHPYMDTRRSYRGTRTRLFAGSWIGTIRLSFQTLGGCPGG